MMKKKQQQQTGKTKALQRRQVPEIETQSEEREETVENYGYIENWYDTGVNNQHNQHEYKESRDGSSVGHYSNKIAQSFWSINRTNTSGASSLENNVGGLPIEEQIHGISEEPIAQSQQLGELRVSHSLARPTRVVRGGPQNKQPLIVRVSTQGSPPDLPTFSLAQFKASLESSDARSSLKHIPPKAVQALNLEESIKERLARQSARYLDSQRCFVRVNGGSSNAAVFAALADTLSKNHRGSKGPRPQLYGEELDASNFLIASQSSYRNLNNNYKQRNEVDFHGNFKSTNFVKNSRSRRSRPRKQSQQQ
eukprot:TRINITY_DN403_c0_g1_i9.p1 TRINITY_DN403_c0_g1~~TRINITY_DN403_c0_g1_i9.p1  ORF type:complete len:320 (-),score=46.68 TRINITY_DN403_c0_g1_i9:919-1845(-)